MNASNDFLGWFLMLLGATLSIIAWIRYRKEGVGFWTLAPIWRANEYVDPPGTTIWYTGFGILVFGILINAT